MPDETNDISNAVSSYVEAVQLSASFLMSLPVFDKICCNSNAFCIFFRQGKTK